MTQLANNFEGGSAATALVGGSSGNTGGTSGNFFNQVNVTTDGIIEFTNAHVAVGSLACRMATRTATGALDLIWTAGTRGSIADDFIRFYFWTDDITTGGVAKNIIRWFSGGSSLGGILIGNGRLYATDNTNAAVSANSTTLLPASQWVRIEAHLHPRTDGTGSIEVQLFLSPSSTTPDWDYTISGLTYSAAFTDQINIGNAGPGANWPTATGFIYFDEIVTGASGWVGPVSTAATTINPTSAVSTAVGPTFDFEIDETPDATALSTAVAPTPTLVLAAATVGSPSALSRSVAPVPTIFLASNTGSLTVFAVAATTRSLAPVPAFGQVILGAATPRLAPMTRYLVEAAWGMSWATGGLFTFGSSLFGGPDVLTAAAFSSSFNVPYGDLTDRSRHATIVRGRDDLLSAMQSGTLTLDLVDPDGLYNSRNTGSPLYGTLYTGVPIRVSAYTSDGTLVPLYYGFISTLTSDPGGRYGTAQITAVDFFTRLQREKPNLGSLDGLTTGSLFSAFLTAVGWIDPKLISLSVGDALPTYTRADGTNDTLSLIEEALTAERGYFFIAGDGTVKYRDRYSVLTGASLATLDRVMTEAPSTLDDSRIVNRWTVDRTDMAGAPIGVPQVAVVDPLSDVSYRRYHYIDGSISTPMLVDDNHALSLAQYLLSLTKNPTGVGWSVPINPADSPTLDQMISRDLGDRVTLTVDPILWGAYTADFTIERIQHDISTDGAGGGRHVTTWGLAEAPKVQPFRFGTSQMGGQDVLVY